MIPEGFCRCVALKRVKLDHNRLITLPAPIHLLPEIEELDLRGNPDLIMPPKPLESKQNLAFYNINFEWVLTTVFRLFYFLVCFLREPHGRQDRERWKRWKASKWGTCRLEYEDSRMEKGTWTEELSFHLSLFGRGGMSFVG